MENIELISKLIEIKKEDIISVVGSGGKTTFLYTLAYELNKSKVLISTTTKMFIPSENFNLLYDRNDVISNGINILIEEKINDKFSATIDSIDFLRHKCDYVLLECDGSKMKPLKGWNSSEPVIPSFSDKTVGIIPMDILYKTINKELIHRMSEFLNITNSNINDLITENTIRHIILNKNGLFKNSIGKKILFLNKIDNCNTMYLKKLIKVLPLEFLDIVIVGSLKKHKFKRIY